MVNYFFSFCCNYPNLPLFHLVSLSQIPTVPRWQGTCLKKKIKIILTLDENPSVHLPRYWPRVLLKTPVCAKHYTSSHHFILYTLRVQLHCLVILQNILDKSSYSFSIVDWFTCVGYTYFLVFKSTHTTKTSTYLIFFSYLFSRSSHHTYPVSAGGDTAMYHQYGKHSAKKKGKKMREWDCFPFRIRELDNTNKWTYLNK